MCVSIGTYSHIALLFPLQYAYIYAYIHDPHSIGACIILIDNIIIL